MKKTNTVALIVAQEGSAPKLVETLSDEFEIELLVQAVNAGKPDPMELIYEFRARQKAQDTSFGDYVEDLLSKPFVNSTIQGHAVKWLKSKIRIERFQKMENDAAQIIAEYAYQVFQKDPDKTDFFLASPQTKIRIRIFQINLRLAA